jgi:hypothetical protein
MTGDFISVTKHDSWSAISGHAIGSADIELKSHAVAYAGAVACSATLVLFADDGNGVLAAIFIEPTHPVFRD